MGESFPWVIPSPNHFNIFLSASISGSTLVSDSRKQKIKSKLILSYPCQIIIRRTRSTVTILSSFPKHTLGTATRDPIKTTQGNKEDIQVQNPLQGTNQQQNQKPRPKNLPQITTKLQTKSSIYSHVLAPLTHLSPCPSRCWEGGGTLSTSGSFLLGRNFSPFCCQ